MGARAAYRPVAAVAAASAIRANTGSRASYAPTLIASGDVYIRAEKPLTEIPEADVVCYGLWVDASLATHHGVFVSSRSTPTELDFMLQKPSLDLMRGAVAFPHVPDGYRYLAVVGSGYETATQALRRC